MFGFFKNQAQFSKRRGAGATRPGKLYGGSPFPIPRPPPMRPPGRTVIFPRKGKTLPGCRSNSTAYRRQTRPTRAKSIDITIGCFRAAEPQRRGGRKETGGPAPYNEISATRLNPNGPPAEKSDTRFLISMFIFLDRQSTNCRAGLFSRWPPWPRPQQCLAVCNLSIGPGFNCRFSVVSKHCR